MGSVSSFEEARQASYSEHINQAATQTVRRFFDLPLLGVVRINPAGIIVEVNATFTALTTKSSNELIGSKFLEVIHSSSQKEIGQLIAELKSGADDTRQIELRCGGSGDESRYCIGSFAAVRSATDKLDSILVALLDITERRDAEKELRNKEIYLRQVIDIIPHLVFAKDKHGRYTLANQEVAKLFNKDLREIVGKTDREINPFPQEYERFQREDDKVIREGAHIAIPEEPLHHLGSDSIRWYQTIKKPLLAADGTVSETLGIASDLTERRRAEHALRSIVAGTASKTAQEFFRSLVHHLAEVIETRFAFIAKVVPGTTQAQMLALWDSGRFLDNIEYDMAIGPTGVIFGKELKLFVDDVASKFPEDRFLIDQGIESYMGAPFFDSSGAPLGVLAVMDTKPMKEWLPAQSILTIFAERAGAELDRIAREKETRKLHKQLLQSQKMDAIGQLAAGIAHDLNNALGAVVGHLQLIKTPDRNEQDLNSSVDVALKGCERATSLIEQLLGFSRQGKYNLEQLDLRRLVDDTVVFLSRVIGKDISIEFTGREQKIFVYADPAQIQQAITNIIINATHAMPYGGKIIFELDIEEVSNPKGFNFNAEPGTYARVSISDTGTGIDKDVLEKVFEPFFSTKSEGAGSGLGLAMVYGTMQNHGGWVKAKSQLNEGSTFELFIPTTTLCNSKKPQIEFSMDETGPTGTILVIDDEPYLVELALTFLERHGLKGKGFTDPESAIEWFSENYSDVALTVMDMKMPKINGSECFKRLRNIHNEAKVVVLSGFIHDDEAQQVLDQGAVRFFQKPLKYPDFMRWIKSQLRSDNVISAP